MFGMVPRQSGSHLRLSRYAIVSRPQRGDRDSSWYLCPSSWVGSSFPHFQGLWGWLKVARRNTKAPLSCKTMIETEAKVAPVPLGHVCFPFWYFIYNWSCFTSGALCIHPKHKVLNTPMTQHERCVRGAHPASTASPGFVPQEVGGGGVAGAPSSAPLTSIRSFPCPCST
jgi:hypothetical protein